ncbi:MAG: patatin-like phospholipase family protein [Jatrophihabitans sp.]|uniref:patatin-like phospholipase family protein n=1 Tax=Jatrophihabitans sp. TaxID=1932789 RepID=UPI003F81D9A7
MATIALALGSGGARGYAHLGVLRALAEAGHEVVSVAGSSMGAVIGGVFSAGRLDDYTDWVTGLSQRDVLRQLVEPGSPGAGGLFRAERVITRVAEIVGDLRIEQLPLPFTAVAVDVVAGREVWLSRGPLDRAIRASMGIPGLFTPVTLDGRVLVDGGLLNPVPVAATTAATADIVGAVSLPGPRRGQPSEAPTDASSDDADTGEGAEATRADWWERVKGRLPTMTESELLAAATQRLGALKRVLPIGGDESSVGLLDVVTLALDAPQAALTRFGLAAYPPDITVTVPADAARSLDFHRAAELIELGHTLAVEALNGR